GQWMAPAFEHPPVREYSLGDIDLVEGCRELAYGSIDTVRARPQIAAVGENAYELLKCGRLRKECIRDCEHFLKRIVPTGQMVACVEYDHALNHMVEHRPHGRLAVEPIRERIRSAPAPAFRQIES